MAEFFQTLYLQNWLHLDLSFAGQGGKVHGNWPLDMTVTGKQDPPFTPGNSLFSTDRSESCSAVSNSLSPHGLYIYTVHGILQARILEWVAFPFSRESSQPKD